MTHFLTKITTNFLYYIYLSFCFLCVSVLLYCLSSVHLTQTEQWQWDAAALCRPVWPLWRCATSAGGADGPHDEEQQVWDSAGPGRTIWPPRGGKAAALRPPQPAQLQHQEAHAAAPGLSEWTPVSGGGAAGCWHGHQLWGLFWSVCVLELQKLQLFLKMLSWPRSCWVT